jgi:hypothetical protein
MAGTRTETNWSSRTADRVASTGPLAAHVYLRDPTGNKLCIFCGV